MKSVAISIPIVVTSEALELVRLAHCSHDNAGGAEHKCAGTVSITPRGVELLCPLCGSDTTCRLLPRREVSR